MPSSKAHLFSAGNIGHLLLSQLLAFNLNKIGDRCYLVHNTNKSEQETDYFAKAFKSLLVKELWEDVYYVNDGGKYSYSNVWPKEFNFSKSNSILGSTEREITSILNNIPNLGHIYFFHLNSPKTNLFASLGMKLGIHLHVVENGYATNMDTPYKADFKIYELNPLSFIRRVLSLIFLWVTKREPWVLLRNYYVVHPHIKFSSLYGLFPEKYPHNNILGEKTPLHSVVTKEAIQYLIDDLASRELLQLDVEENACVFVSRPDDIDTFLTSENYEDITRKILVILTNKHGKTYIKPHPREDYSRCVAIADGIPGVDVLDCSHIIPIELIAPVSGIKYWYGSWSYGLLTLKKLFNLQVKVLLPIYIKELDLQGCDIRKYQRVFDQNYKLYKDEIDWVFSLSDVYNAEMG